MRGTQTIVMRRPFRFVPTWLFAPILCAVLLIGCATAPEGGVARQGLLDEINDPLEPMNRAIFKFNQFADGIFIKPLAQMYGQLVPDMARRGVRNFLDNLRTPVTLANDILQGKAGRAAITIKRFAINSTVGIGGLLDMATRFGVEERHREDFGQTLATWGSDEGIYRMLPLLGPSNPRDAIGLVADGFLDPVSYLAPAEAVFGRSLVRGIDDMTFSGALIIGLSQVLALVPGTSRSGITMTAARGLGFTRAESARFSMLLSIPVIAAAGLPLGLQLYQAGDAELTANMIAAAGVAFGAALAAIGLMMPWLERASFTPFVVYRVVLGGGLLVWAYW